MSSLYLHCSALSSAPYNFLPEFTQQPQLAFLLPFCPLPINFLHRSQGDIKMQARSYSFPVQNSALASLLYNASNLTYHVTSSEVPPSAPGLPLLSTSDNPITLTFFLAQESIQITSSLRDSELAITSARNIPCPAPQTVGSFLSFGTS